MTVLSLAVAVLMTTAGLFLATKKDDRKGDIIGGGLIGVGVASMHFLGMNAIEMPADIAWDPVLVDSLACWRDDFQHGGHGGSLGAMVMGLVAAFWQRC